MKHLMSIITVVAVMLLFSGCVNSMPKPPAKVDLGIQKKDMKIYVDNTLDKEKQKRVRDALVYSLRKMIKNNQFKLVKTKGYKGISDWDTVVPRLEREITYHNGFQAFGGYNVHVYEFGPFHYVNLYNIIFDGKHDLGGDLFGSDNYYKTVPHYTIKKIGDTAFEVKGFKNVEEAVDIYLQIIRNSNDNETFGHSYFKSYIREYLKKTKAGIDWTCNLYYTNIVRYDPYELSEHHRLILRPTILEASKKYQLIQLLKQKHYTVVDNPKDANVIISVQNLAFGPRDRMHIDSKIITNKIKNMRIVDPNQASFEYAQAGADFASMNTPTSNTMAGASVALGLLSLFSTSEYDITTIDYVSIFVNGKNLLNRVITPKLYSIEEEADNFKYGIAMNVGILNYASAMEIEKLLF